MTNHGSISVAGITIVLADDSTTKTEPDPTFAETDGWVARIYPSGLSTGVHIHGTPAQLRHLAQRILDGVPEDNRPDGQGDDDRILNYDPIEERS